MSEENNDSNSSYSPFRGQGGRIIIAGGGTGGHIFPALAIANAIKKIAPETQILFVGAKGKMEMEKVPQAGYEITVLDIVGFNRSSLIKNIGLPYKILKSFLQVQKIFKSFKPDAVVGVGGYSSFPVLRYAQHRAIKTFLHESNSFAGKANVMLGKRATEIFTASDGMEKFFPKEKTLLTGNPIRKNILLSIQHEDAIKFFALNDNKKTVLAIGGSLGAKSINEAIATHIDDFAKNNLQLIWQTGSTTIDQFKHLTAGRNNIWISDFIAEMKYAYAAADMVVARAGAMTIAELVAVKKPSILIPYPFAAEDHQTANAMNLVKKDAAIMVKDNEAKEKLMATIIDLSKNEALQNILKQNISSLAINNADDVIANEILKSIN